MAQTHQVRADELKAIRDAQIPKEYRISTDNLPLNVSQTYKTCGLLSDHQLGILDLDATALAQAIAARKYTSIEVIEAFIISASVAQQTINCLASLDAEQARSRARSLDEQLEQTGKTVGPLHGVPISVKDFVWIKDWPQTAGNVNSYKVPTDDAHLIAILRAAGVVFYVKGTQPQSIMHLETYNFYGRTQNPYNRNLTPGGSSGGDAALVAARGSSLGVTTDVGGSTRGPAGDCGLWGYKPTSKRIPRYGVQPVSTSSRIAGAVGPVAHTFRDIELFTKIIFAAEGWRDDVILMPLPWRDVAADGSGLGFQPWQGAGGKLRVGVVYNDGVVRPLKPMRRALHDMAAKLETAGHEVVAFEGFAQTDGKAKIDVARAWKLTAALYWTDGGESLRQALGDEPLLPMTEWILAEGSGPLTRDQITVLIAERNTMRQAMLDAMKAQRLDILLCPPSPGPARPHETSKYWSYTSFYNLMDWPGLVFPTGRQVSVKEDEEEPHYKPRNETEKHVYDTYSAEYSVDAPIGLQLVAPRWQDERLFAATKIIESSLPL